MDWMDSIRAQRPCTHMHMQHRAAQLHGPCAAVLHSFTPSAERVAGAAVLVSLYEEPDKPKQAIEYVAMCVAPESPSTQPFRCL